MSMKKITFLILSLVVGMFSATSVFGQYYDSLFIVGDATPSGWNISSPQPFARDASDTNVFTWQGTLTAGQVKFSTFTGNWCDGDWLLATDTNQVLTSKDYTIFTGCPADSLDKKWKVTAETAGSYMITVDLDSQTVDFKRRGFYDSLFIVGDATPSGWNINSPQPFVRSTTDTNIFTWQGTLTAGQVKFSTFTGNWCDGDWILASDTNQVLTSTDYGIYTGCPSDSLDRKWKVTAGEAGDYLITVDLKNMTVSFEKQVSGIKESGLSGCRVYPNPATDLLNINIGEEQVATVTIYSMVGETLYQAEITNGNNSIDLHKIHASGLILVKVSANSYSQIFKISTY